MARTSNKKDNLAPSKTTRQGAGTYTKTPTSGGETFYGNKRSGSPPSKARRRRKPSRGQG